MALPRLRWTRIAPLSSWGPPTLTTSRSPTAHLKLTQETQAPVTSSSPKSPHPEICFPIRLISPATPPIRPAPLQLIPRPPPSSPAIPAHPLFLLLDSSRNSFPGTALL